MKGVPKAALLQNGVWSPRTRVSTWPAAREAVGSTQLQALGRITPAEDKTRADTRQTAPSQESRWCVGGDGCAKAERWVIE